MVWVVLLLVQQQGRCAQCVWVLQMQRYQHYCDQLQHMRQAVLCDCCAMPKGSCGLICCCCCSIRCCCRRKRLHRRQGSRRQCVAAAAWQCA